MKAIIARGGQVAAKNLSLTDYQTWDELLKAYRDGAGRISAQKAYEKVGFFRRCIRLRANGIGRMPLEVRLPGGKLWQPGQPTPAGAPWLASLPTWAYRAEASMAVSGWACFLLERLNGRFTGLYYFNPETVEAVITPAGIAGYKRQLNSREVGYTADQMCVVTAPDPYAEIGKGSSDGGAAIGGASVLLTLDEFLNEHLTGGLIKATAWIVPENTPTKERDRFERWVNRMYGRFGAARNSKKQKVMSSAVQPVTIGEGFEGLSNIQLTQEQREAVSTALGVPHSLVMSNSANYATANAESVGFITNTLIPEAGLIAEAFNRQWLSPLGYEMAFKPERLEAMQAYELDKAGTIVGLTGGPVLTLNEGRELLGKEPLPGGVGEKMATVAAAEKGAREAEAGRWRRKVENHGREVAFKCHHLSHDEAGAVRSRLADGLPLEEVFAFPLDF